jgi:protein SCO1/2
MIGGMLRILVVGLVLLVAVMFMLPRPGAVAAPEVATWLPQPLALPAVELVDDSNRPFGLESLRGAYSLMFFGFTHCPDVCPLTLQVLAQARAELNASRPESTPAVVFVSVDPHRDTPDRIRDYLSNFDPEMIGVTASDPALEPLLEALGVSVQKHEHGGENYNVVHNSTIYFLSPEAELIAVSSAPHDAPTIAADFLKIRRLHERPRRPSPPGS